MSLGANDFFKRIGDYKNGELTILGGRPGMGKTSLALDIANNYNGKVLYVFLEPSKFKKQRINNHVYFNTINKKNKLPVSIAEIRSLLFNDINSFDFVIIDYIQLIKTRTPLKELKIIAEQINKPVLALSQLNRCAEERKDHRPKFNELRSIGKEQLAYIDKILLLYRENYYNCEFQTNIAEITTYINQSAEYKKIFIKYNINETGIVFV